MSDEEKPETPVIRLVPKRAPEPEPEPVVEPTIPDEDIMGLLAEATALAAEGKLNGIVLMLETKELEGEGYLIRWTESQSLIKRLGFFELAKSQQLSQIGFTEEEE